MAWPLIGTVQAEEAVQIGAPPAVSGVVLAPQGRNGAGVAGASLTERWLHLQASGQAASSHPQQATPQERELTNRRLLESYRHPIPEFFEQDMGGEIAR